MSFTKIATDYKNYERSSVMKELALRAHGPDYVGQTSSATFQEISSIIQTLRPSSMTSLLDAGCGNGAFSLPLALNFRFNILGIDISEGVIEIAKKKAIDLELQDLCVFKVQDFNTFECLESFDLILSVGSLYWNPSLEVAFSNWYHTLKPNGNLLLFLNLQEKSLLPEEKNFTKETTFIPIDVMKHHLYANRFKDIYFEDQTLRYQKWLEKWCKGMIDLKEQIFGEMGIEKGTRMIHRFQTYLTCAKEGKIKRMIIRASK